MKTQWLPWDSPEHQRILSVRKMVFKQVHCCPLASALALLKCSEHHARSRGMEPTLDTKLNSYLYWLGFQRTYVRNKDLLFSPVKLRVGEEHWPFWPVAAGRRLVQPFSRAELVVAPDSIWSCLLLSTCCREPRLLFLGAQWFVVPSLTMQPECMPVTWGGALAWESVGEQLSWCAFGRAGTVS